MELNKLLELEKATRIILQRYENSVKNYDGTINDDTAAFAKFNKYNNFYLNILNKLEEKVTDYFEKDKEK